MTTARIGTFLASIGIVFACAVLPSLAVAGPWPEKTVRIIVPFAAGGAADVVTRIVAARISENLNRNFVVENRTGGNGIIGTEIVARAAADGYTILAGSPGTLAINPHMYPNLPYDALSDFVCASHVATFPQILAINSKIEAPTLKDFIAYAKNRPNTLTMGSSGIGSTGHLIAAMFMHEAGISAVHVPFRGGGPAAQALVAGTVDFVIDGLPTFQGFIGTNALRVLAITSAKRWPKLPDLPAIAETIPNFDLSSWVIFAFRNGTDPEIIHALANEVNKAIASEDVQRKLLEVGALAVGGSQKHAAQFQRSELAKWKTVVEISGTRAN